MMVDVCIALRPAEATKRGLGAALLKKPTKLAKMVAGIAAQVDLPITVKIRTGEHLYCTVHCMYASWCKTSAAWL